MRFSPSVPCLPSAARAVPGAAKKACGWSLTISTGRSVFSLPGSTSQGTGTCQTPARDLQAASGALPPLLRPRRRRRSCSLSGASRSSSVARSPTSQRMAGGSASTTKERGAVVARPPQPSSATAATVCSPGLQEAGQALSVLPPITGRQDAALAPASSATTSTFTVGATNSRSATSQHLALGAVGHPLGELLLCLDGAGAGRGGAVEARGRPGVDEHDIRFGGGERRRHGWGVEVRLLLDDLERLLHRAAKCGARP